MNLKHCWNDLRNGSKGNDAGYNKIGLRKKMDNGLSLSIFVIEADLKPVLAFAAKKNSDAEIILLDERIRAKLRSVNSGGRPVCNDLSILRLRLARSEERAIYNDKASSMESGMRMVYLFKLDEIDDVGDQSPDA
jgi:hypothetical protein